VSRKIAEIAWDESAEVLYQRYHAERDVAACKPSGWCGRECSSPMSRLDGSIQFGMRHGNRQRCSHAKWKS
jgi:hypothetical protein